MLVLQADSSMHEGVIIALVSVGIGWALSQGSFLAKDWWTVRRLRKGLVEELEDVREQLSRIVLIYGRNLQVLALKGIAPDAALPVPNFFFKHAYKDVFSHLNRHQRISYQLIHTTLDSLNAKSATFAELTERLVQEASQAKSPEAFGVALRRWGDHVKSLYQTSRDLQWHIDFHLKNPDTPKYDILGHMHELYLKFQVQVEQEIKDLMENAKSLKKEDFEQVYDEKRWNAQRRKPGDQ